MNYVETTRALFQRGLMSFAGALDYIPQGKAAVPLRGFIRGLRSDDTFAAAMQQDQVAVVSEADFRTLVGQDLPRRFDRIIVQGQSLAVQEWRPAPQTPPTVFFKILIRGSQQ